MQRLFILVSAVAIAAGCNSSPTAPTPPPIVNAPVTPPTSSTPTAPSTPNVPAPNPLLSDPRFSLSFYRMFALGDSEGRGLLLPMIRQPQAPRIYLRTVMDTGALIDTRTLDSTAAALINTTGALTGVFGLAGLEQGTSNRLGQPGWITVEWMSATDVAFCGIAEIGGASIRLYPNTPGCRCAGGPAIRPRTVKHELGHALGFYHTNSLQDLMSGLPDSRCDQDPSDRERFHATLAYQQPIGSLDPK